MTNPMTIVIAQLDRADNSDAANAARIGALVEAHGEADLIVLPHRFLGERCADTSRHPSHRQATRNALAQIAADVARIAGPAVLVGAPISTAQGSADGALLITPNGAIAIAAQPDIAPAARAPIAYRGARLGVGLNADLETPFVAQSLAGGLADLLIFLTDAPYRRGEHNAWRRRHAEQRARETRLPTIVVNPIGGDGENVFDGASFAVAADGGLAFQAAAFAADSETLTLPLVKPNDRAAAGLKIHRANDRPWVEPYPSAIAADYIAMVVGLRAAAEHAGLKNALAPLSGGLDSALAAAIAVDAFGPKAVTAIILPNVLGAKGAAARALSIANTLGVTVETVAVGDSVAALRQALTSARATLTANGALEHAIAARARMTVLAALARTRQQIVIAPANKSELAIGAATLAGDAITSFAPLSDIYKTEIWDLARYRNAHCPVGALGIPGPTIPTALIDSSINAALVAVPSDQADLGPQKALDGLLSGLIDYDLEPEAALAHARRLFAATLKPEQAAQFLTIEHANRIAAMVARAALQRRRGAPGVIVTPSIR